MCRSCLVSCLLLSATAWIAAPAEAQTRWSVTPYAGVLVTDDDFAGEGGELEFLDDPSIPPDQRPDLRTTLEVEDAALFGVRVGLFLEEAWGVEATYGYASFSVVSTVDVTRPVPEIDDPTNRVSLTFSDHGLHLWEGAVRYAFGGDRLRPFLVGGIGGATTSTSFPILGDDEAFNKTTTDLALVLGGGIRWDVRSHLGIRLDARDHLQWCGGVCLSDDTVLHQVEISGGLEVDL